MVLLNYNFIFMCVHAWCHAVFRMLIAKVCRGIYISKRRDMALPRVSVHGVYVTRLVFTRHVEFIRDVEFTRDGNVTFSRDAVVLTKLSNWQDSSCL